VSVFVLSCVRLAAGRSPVQGVLPTLCKIDSFRLTLKWEEARGPILSKEEEMEQNIPKEFITELSVIIYNSVAFSQQANYTDRATAACRRG
jgi:hypothetical protein